MTQDLILKLISNPKSITEDVCPFSGKSLDNFKIFNYKNTFIKVNGDIDLSDFAHFYENEWYESSSNHFVLCTDTKRHIPFKKAYQHISGRFMEKIPDDMIEYNGRWIEKAKCGIAYDTGNLVPINNLYTHNNRYYEYHESFDKRNPFYYNYMKIEDSEERRVGLEFEFGNARKLAIAIFEDNDLRTNFASVRDGSLDRIDQGYEFVSAPIKISEVEHYVRKITELAKKTNAVPHKDCGFHVHIGASDLNFHDVASTVKVCTNIETELLSKFPKSRHNNRYCRKLDGRFEGFSRETDKHTAGEILYDGNNANFHDRHKYGKYRDGNDQRGIRYFWLSLDRLYQKRQTPKEKTIEFRIHEATLDADRFIGFIHLCYAIVNYGKHRSRNTANSTDLNVLKRFTKPIYRKHIQNFIDSDVPEELSKATVFTTREQIQRAYDENIITRAEAQSLLQLLNL